MSTTLHWTDIALRLALTVAVGILIGLNRSERGKAVGMRTTLLVCLAAAVAMIQVNLLLPTAGRPANSFVMNDLMRLPLGILTGVGFIGGGAILRRETLVVGVTTAATLWLVTVIGLCLGGGQIVLGLAATALGLFALWGLKWVENGLEQEHRAEISIEIEAQGPSEAELRQALARAGISVAASAIAIEPPSGRRKLELAVRRNRRLTDTATPPVLGELTRLPGVVSLRWKE